MVKRDVTVKSATGLHARPGTKLVELAMTFEASVKLIKDGQEINAKEIFDVLSAGINFGDVITVVADGIDEEKALVEITNYIETTEE